jgi:hypothetical protein
MQTRKIRVFLGALFAVLLLAAAACGPRPGHDAGGAASPAAGFEAGSGAGDERAQGTGHQCASSDDCDEGLICVDGECMIPKLMR